MTEKATTIDELAFTRPYGEQEKQILTAEAVEFLTELVTHFTPQLNKLLAARIQQQQDIDNGRLPDFISETASIRDADWKIRGIPADLEDRRPYGEQEKQILTAEAVEFLTELVTHFTPQRNKLLAARIQQQQDIDNGRLPDFISETASIRDADWKIRGIPADLEDRRVEITGPVERKMVINALNANVKVFMADFEDSLAPDWNKVIDAPM